MDSGIVKKVEPPLPPGYVSLEMLRQRWLRMQEARKNNKEEKEEEEVNRGDNPRLLLDRQGLGDEKEVDRGEAVKKKKKSYRKKKKKEKKRMEREEKEMGYGDKTGDEEIVGDDFKVEVQGTETEPRYGVGEQIGRPNRGGFRRNGGGDWGFRRNDGGGGGDREFRRNDDDDDGDKLGRRGGKGYRLETEKMDLGKNQRESEGQRNRVITKRDGDGDGGDKLGVKGGKGYRLDPGDGMKDLRKNQREYEGERARIIIKRDGDGDGGDKLVYKGGKGHRLEPNDRVKEGGLKLDLRKNQREYEGQRARIITKRDGEGDGGGKLGYKGGKGYRLEPDDRVKESGLKWDLRKNQRESQRERNRIITKGDRDGVDKFGGKGGKGYKFEPDDGVKVDGLKLDLRKKQKESEGDISVVITKGEKEGVDKFGGKGGKGGRVEHDDGMKEGGLKLGFRKNKKESEGERSGITKGGKDGVDKFGGKGYRLERDDRMKVGRLKSDLRKKQKESEGERSRIITKGDGDGVAASKNEVLEVTNRIRGLDIGFKGKKDERGEIRGRGRRMGGFVCSRYRGSLYGVLDGSMAHSRRGNAGNRQDRPQQVWVKKGEIPGDSVEGNAI